MADDRNRRCLIPNPNLPDEDGNPTMVEGMGTECNAPGAVPIDNDPPPASEENAGTLGAPTPPTPPPAPTTTGNPQPTGEPASTTGSAAPTTTVSPPSPSTGGSRDAGSGQSDGRPLAQQYYDPNSQIRDYDLANLLASLGVPPDQWDAAIEAILRNQPPPGMPHPYFGLDNRTLLDALGDPVLIFSGQYSLTITDVEIPSRGFPLRLVRLYRSGEVYFGPWGYNWDHSYNCYLRELSGGGAAIWTGQLNEDVYAASADGFEPPLGVFRKLERLLADTVDPDRYVLSDREGNKQIFYRSASWPLSDRIPLMALEDAHGNRHRLTYDAEGRLARVNDDAGRFIQFDYGDCGLVETVSDHTGRRWRYDHDVDIEHLIAVTTPGTDEYPEGLTTRYEYDRDQAYPALAHSLLRVIDPAERLVIENQYGDDPQSYNFGRVIYQQFGDFVTVYDTTQLQFPPRDPGAVNAPTWRVEVIDPGVLHVYTFNYRGDLLDHRFRLASDGTFRVVVDAYRYDSQGNTIERWDPNGHGTLITYDHENVDPRARGNVMRLERVAPPPFVPESRLIMTCTYEPQFHRIKGCADEGGQITKWTYDYEVGSGSVGDVVQIEFPAATLPDGTSQPRVERYRKNDHGQLVERTTAAGHRHVLTYETGGSSDGYLRSIVFDADGVAHREQFEYDAWGNAAAFIDGAGRRVERQFNALGQLRVFRRPPIGSATDDTCYFYSKAGQLRRAEEPRGAYVDAVIADPFIASEWDYNVLGQLVEARRFINTATPAVTRFSRDAEGRALVMIDPLGRTTRRTVDERGLLIRSSEAVGLPEEATYQYTYDLNGNRTSLTDPTGYRFDYTYDPWDRLVELAMPGSEAERTRIRLRLNRFDRTDELTITGLFSPGAVGTLFHATSAYDERGRLVRRDVGDRVAICTYDPDERLIVRRDVRGNDVTFVYDGLNRVVQNGDPLGNLEIRTFASDGTLSRIERHEALPGGSGFESLVDVFQYDERRRPRAVTDPIGRTSTLRYDARDVLVEQIDPLGQSSKYDVGARGEVKSLTLESRQGHSIVHAFEIDLGGRQRTYTDPLGRVTRYDFDARDRRIATTCPDGRIRQIVYDTRLQRKQELLPSGSRIDYQYGPDAGLSRIEFTAGPGIPAASPIDIFNDGLRRQTRITQDGRQLTRSFDAFSRLTEDGYDGHTTRVVYSDAEGAIRRTYSDGRTDRIELDELGRPRGVTIEKLGALPLSGISVGTELARWEWRGRTRIGSRTLHCGAATLHDYDAASNLTSIRQTAAGGANVSVLRYVHDAAGRRRLVWGSPEPQTTCRLDYDGLSRLVGTAAGLSLSDPGPVLDAATADAVIANAEVLAASSEETYQLDDADGRIELAQAGTPDARIDRLTLAPSGEIANMVRTGSGAGTYTFSYDANGDCTADDRYRYVWNAARRLIEVRSVVDGTTVMTQEYDPLGRVSRRTVAGTTTDYEHHRLRVVARRDNATGVVTQVTHGMGIDEVVLESTPAANRWALQDASGTLLAWVDDAANVTERYGFSPFGEVQIYGPDGTTERATSEIGAAPVFAGHQALPVGLYDARARLYDARLGRFLSPNPAGFVDGPNLYTYVHHDPVHWVDPTGEIGIIGTIIVIAGTGLLAGAAIDGCHQGIEMAEGSRDDFDFGEMGWSGVKGAVLAPVVAFVPEVGIGLAGLGTYNGVQEIRAGHTWSGIFDIGVSLAPFASKSVRNASFGEGSVIGAMRDLGPIDSWATRVARFNTLGQRFAHDDSTVTRVTHVSTAEGINSIKASGDLLNAPGASGIGALFDGTQTGAWVSPWRASELGLWGRAMTGLFRRPYVEFDVQPGELSRPGGIKFGFSRWQRQILLDGDPNLAGRNPTFGTLPGDQTFGPGVFWPWLHVPSILHSGPQNPPGNPPAQNGSMGAAIAPTSTSTSVAQK